jgi:MFS family permease
VPYVDTGTAAYATLAALAVERARATEARAWGALAGAAAAFAASSKHLGLVCGIVAAAALVRARRWRAPAAFAAAAVPLAAPWYVYAAVHTGNPVHPFLRAWFGGAQWNAGDAERVMAATTFGRGVSPSSLLHLPWDLTFNQGILGPDLGYLPIFLFVLALAPLAAWTRWLRLPLALVAAYGAFWFATGLHSLRYLLPVSPLFALVAAGLLVEAARRLRLPQIAPVVLAVALAARMSARAAISLAREGFPLSPAAREAYLGRQLVGYGAYTWLDRHHPEGYVVYGLDMERMFYFTRNGRQVGEVFGPWRFVDYRPLLADPGALAARLAARGVDHLIVGRGDLEPRGFFRVEWESPEKVLYEITAARR